MGMSSNNVWIAVPTYWTWPTGEAGDERTVFDHPTPLDQDGTLARTLDSFRKINGEFRVIVIAAAAHPELGARVREKAKSILEPFASELRLYLASPVELDRLNRCLDDAILGLNSYGSIRNVQLAAPYALGADVVVGIDDDEIVEDRTFLAKALEYIGRQYDGEFVGGMAGPYVDRDGDYRIAGAEELRDHPNLFVKKNYFMNEAVKQAVAGAGPGEIVRSNVAFGGNMCMARRTIARVCHDPYIPRGEDYDYVINAAMSGMHFYFRPDMRIVHLPPDSTGSQAADKPSKLLADIRRFIYMREKMRHHEAHYPSERVDRAYLMPYPGVYLDEAADLEAQGVAALDGLDPELRAEQSPDDFVRETVETARRKAEEFFTYRAAWAQSMASIADDTAFRDAVEALEVQ